MEVHAIAMQDAPMPLKSFEWAFVASSVKNVWCSESTMLITPVCMAGNSLGDEQLDRLLRRGSAPRPLAGGRTAWAAEEAGAGQGQRCRHHD